MNNLSVLSGPYIQKIITIFMKSKQKKSKYEKSVVISTEQLTKIGLKVFSKFLKTVDDAKRLKITIKLEKA